MSRPFFNVDPVAEADPISRSVVHLTMEFQDPNVSDSKPIPLATGTGIVASIYPDTFILVTAWHNLSGRNPISGKPMRGDGALPNWVRVNGFHFKHRAKLRAGDNNPGLTNPLYLVHPAGPQVDVVVLPLPGVTQCNCDFGRLLTGGVGENVRVADTVFVVGFPLKLTNQVDPNTPLPIWKIGNIANDPGPDFDDLPRFLVDATTLPGMSGAPVVRRFNYAGDPAHQFLGIYVGRYLVPRSDHEHQGFGNEPRNESSALGWVIKLGAIFEILKGGAPNDPNL